ncbi:NAD(P)H-hydrate dehydratase [Phenylobacterium deserti]|uniref:ADP-dependent (S)-NAD(P)H-hydrate dehydratase n=1 Tax=Phenylobacterium deserti TaxID=1914756 RepID=A0A328ABI4_9CAUL|nr:NAD(P)H-hydrate dehydratase [Phenylobacterium deserti]RAK50724.1 NAD(P)H-hydrate dehydratase [Phenylobacterium deserti]
MTAPVEVTPDLLQGWPLPTIPDDGDKEDRGRVLVLAAGAEVAGATLLTAVAALRAGAGKLQVGAPRSLAQPLAFAIPEARILPAAETDKGELSPDAADELKSALARSDAAVIGPGMLDEDAAGELTLRLLDGEGPPLVLDAAAMQGLPADPGRARALAGRMVLTPHAGEMAALTGRSKEDIAADPLSAARRLAADLKAVVIAKGACSYIVSPDGSAWRHESPTVGLATSGSGDVLAGIIAGLLARGASPAQAAVFGVYAHAQAGLRLSKRVGRMGFLARELLDEIAPVLCGLEAGT